MPPPDPAASRSNHEWWSSLRPPLNLQPVLLPEDAADADRVVAELLNAALEGPLSRVKMLVEELNKANKGVNDAVAAAAASVCCGPLHLAVGKGNVEICRFLIENCGLDVNATDSYGATPMIYASQGLFSTSITELLLSSGADLNKADNCGVAPLHIAVERDLCELVKLLLQHKADYNKYAGSFSTPLVIAARKGLTECIKCLLEAGADANMCDENGKVPLKICAINRMKDCVEILFPVTTPLPEYEVWSIDAIMEMNLQYIHDELLEYIFFRLNTMADLACVSSTCTTFHQIISTHRFLRRFRSLHPTPVLGVFGIFQWYRTDWKFEFHPADSPHSSALAVRALKLADFSLENFVSVFDCRDGRVLLCSSFIHSGTNLVVWEPLYNRRVYLPPIPDILVASVANTALSRMAPFLDAASEEEKDNLTFRVFYVAVHYGKLVILQFSSVSGEWCSFSINSSAPSSTEFPWLQLSPGLADRHYAHGCFYWSATAVRSILKVDLHERKFSVINIPPFNHRQVAIVEARDGRLGLVSLGTMFLDIYSQNICDIENWQYDSTVRLPGVSTSWKILGTAKNYALLQEHFVGSLPNRPRGIYTLDLNTCVVEKFCQVNQVINNAQLYATFLPPLSLPSI